MNILGLVIMWVLIVGFFALAVFLTILAVRSRKTYRCSECGEAQRVEYLDARRCSHCGAPLQQATPVG